MSATPRDLAMTMLRRATVRRDADARYRDECMRGVLDVLTSCRGELGIEGTWLIGSLVWGNFGLRSDIDVVIDGGGLSVDLATRLGDRIGAVTGRSVDVLLLDKLPEAFRARVIAEGLRVS